MSDSLPALHVAAGRGDVESIRALLTDGADPNSLHAESGVSALHVAAHAGSVPAVELLLASGAFLNLQAPTTGVTPLMSAVWARQPQVVARLLDEPGVDTAVRAVFGSSARELIGFGARADDEAAQRQICDLNRMFDDYERRRGAVLDAQPLFRALTDQTLTPDERTALVRRAIADGAEVNTVSPVWCTGDDGHTPLLVAARDGNAEAAAALLEAGADQTLTDEYMHAVPAHKAAFNGHDRVLAALVQAPGFDAVLNAQGPVNGYTPLHDATWHGHLECVRILVDAGARTDLRGYDDKSASDLAREYGYADCLAILTD